MKTNVYFKSLFDIDCIIDIKGTIGEKHFIVNLILNRASIIKG